MKRSWIIGAGVALTWAIGAVACGQSASTTSATDNSGGSGPSGPSSTSGNPSSTSASTASGEGGMTSSSATTASGMGGAGGTGTGGSGGMGQCNKPGTLHPPPDAGLSSIYCPFSGVDGGPNDYCTPGTEKCCETPKGAVDPSACVPIGQACNANGDTEWKCEDPVADCQAGEVCCSNVGGTFVNGGMQGGMVCANFASKMTGTSCQAGANGACPANTIQLCTSDGECPAAAPTCTPFGKAGNQVGACR